MTRGVAVEGKNVLNPSSLARADSFLEITTVGSMPLILASCALLGLAAPDAADPTPTPAPHVRVKATAKPPRSAVNLCIHATLYTWPAESGLPNQADAPPANGGERFQIRKGPRYTTDGHSYYETTIPVPAGLGGPGYYWVSARCFNPD